MTILLLFNQSSTWTVEEMQNETKIELNLLLQTLCSLFKHKLLTCRNLNNDQIEDLTDIDNQMNYKFQLSENFTRLAFFSCSIKYIIKDILEILY